jgi:hypothetical protein
MAPNNSFKPTAGILSILLPLPSAGSGLTQALAPNLMPATQLRFELEDD